MPRVSLRSQRGGKPYGAAFPMLDSLAVEAAVKAGRPCCQWTNEAGVVVGHVAIRSLTDDLLVMTTRLLGAINVGYRFGDDQVSIARQRRNDTHHRPMFRCPACGRTVQQLYAVTGRWECRLCHDLVSIKRLLGPVTLHLRRLMELTVLVERGRPRYGRVAKFNQLREEYGRLVAELSHAPPLPAELRFAQYPEWLPADDPRLKHAVEPGEAGYGWTRYDEGGFRRLTWLAEREHRVHGEAELATRGRPAASAVKPLAAKQGGRVEAPYMGGAPALPPGPAEPGFRFDPAALGLDDADDGEEWKDWRI